MSYLKLSDLDGRPRFGGKGFMPGIPNIVVSTNGSRSSNGKRPRRSEGWGSRYATKNNQRAFGRMSRRG